MINFILKWFGGFFSDEVKNIVTKNGYTYYVVSEKEIPRWVWKKVPNAEATGQEWSSHKGKKYRYIIQWTHNGYNCWKRERGSKK